MKEVYPDFPSGPQTILAFQVTAVLVVLYFWFDGVTSFHPWHIFVAMTVWTLSYLVGSRYFPSAVITVKPKCFQGDNNELLLRTDGKTYSIQKESPQIKIYFSQRGNHMVYLCDKDGGTVSDPQSANTYEDSVVYVEFPKENKKK